MNLWILFLVAVLALLFSYVVSNRMIFTPSVVYSATYVFAIIVCICSRNWIFNPSINTIIVIFGGIMSFGITQFFVKRLRIKQRVHMGLFVIKEREWQKRLFAFLSIGCMLIFLIFIISIGGGISVFTIINARRWLLYNPIPSVYGHIVLLSRAMGCIYLFLAADKKICRGEKLHFVDIIPIISYLMIEILSTSRSGIIYFMGYTLECILILMYKSPRGGFQFSKKAKSVIVKIVVTVAISFLALGYLTGKTTKLGVTNMISVYFGGSIYNLNYYLDNMHDFSSPSFGYFTLPIINSVKSLLGMSVAILDEYYLPFVPIQLKEITGLQTTSNLYTSLTKPILDYGFIGAAFFWILIGTVYSGMFYHVINKKWNGLEIILFSYMMMPVFVLHQNMFLVVFYFLQQQFILCFILSLCLE